MYPSVGPSTSEDLHLVSENLTEHLFNNRLNADAGYLALPPCIIFSVVGNLEEVSHFLVSSFWFEVSSSRFEVRGLP